MLETTITKRAVLATTTYATRKSKWEQVRADCALKTIALAVEHGYEIVAVDGGSPDEYIAEMRRLGAHVFMQEVPGMGNARRQTLRRALELADSNQAIIWIEPEKYPMVQWLAEGVAKIVDEKHDLVMFRRITLDSYPPEQAMTYKMVALAFKYLTGIDSDYLFGPTGMSQRAVQYFLNYESKFGDLWDSIHSPKVRIIHDGLPWTIVTVDYRHPPEQTEAETGMDLFMKRVEQIRQVVEALTYEVDSLGMRLK